MPKNLTAAGARLTMKLSPQWVKEIPAGAIALIVAECIAKDRTTPMRRVALEWLHGDRNDANALHAAAAKLPNTAALAEAGQEVERQESDGSCSLSSSERCQVRWVVRSIPVGIITCWTGFEDGINPPVQAAPAQLASVPVTPVTKPAAPIQAAAPTASPVPAKVAQTEPQFQPINKTVAKAAEPSRTGAQYSADATSPAYPEPLPVFAPLSALIFDKKKALQGNCAAPDGKFITDGRILLVRSACDPRFLGKLKPADCGAFGLNNPVPEASMQKLFDLAVPDARYDAEVRGYMLGSSAGITVDPDLPLVCLVGPSGRVAIIDGHRLRFIQSVTGANHIKRDSADHCAKAVLYKDDQPVAIAILIDMPKVKALFEKMLEANSRANITSITPAATRRVAS